MLNKLTFQNKLFVLLSIFLLIILLISGVAFYWHTVSIIEKNISNLQKQTTQKVQEQVDKVLYDMDRLAISINSSKHIMDMIKNIPYSEENYFDDHTNLNNAIRDAIFSYTSLEPLKGRISIITKFFDYTDINNKLDNQIVTKDYIRSIERISMIMNSNQYKMFMPPHQDDWSTNRDMVFSVVRPLRDTFEVHGVVEVNQRIEELDKLFTFKDTEYAMNAMILDEQLKPIYSNQPFNEVDTQAFSKHIDSNIGSFVLDNRYIVTYSKMNNVEWTIIILEDKKELHQPVTKLKSIIITTYIIVFIALLMALYLFVKHISSPLKQLKKAIVSIDMDELQIDHSSSNNEITVLQFAFQDLLNKIMLSNNRMIESKTRENHAHMLALQAQLKPHFLYNTLSVIGAYGQKKGNFEVMAMCVDLSNMLRYTIEMTDEVTVASEVRQIKSYLSIMHKRFDGMMTYSIQIEPIMECVKIPKLTLEPLVENCFSHGFKDVEPLWNIYIKGYIEGDKWRLILRDNGRGFDFQRLESLQKEFQRTKEEYSSYLGKQKDVGGIGMINTLMRLHIYYFGQEYVRLYNDNGAVIEIGGPLDRMEV